MTLPEILICIVKTYLYGAIECIWFSCHIRISWWIHTLCCSHFIRLLWAWISWIFRQIQSVDSFWNANVTWEEHTLNTAQSFGQFGQIWVFVYDLSGCVFASCFSHSNFRSQACFDQGVLRNTWDTIRVSIHSEIDTWHDKNVQSNAPYRWVLIIQINNLASFTKWLSVHLQTNWLWIQVFLQ